MQKTESIQSLKSIKNLEFMASYLPGIISWKDINSTYLGMNELALAISGLNSFNDFIGKNDYDLWPKFAQEIVEHDQAVIQTGTILQTEERITQPDGKVVYFSIAKIPLRDDNNNIIGVISNALDITKQKRKRLQYLEELAPSMPGPIYWKDKNSVYMGMNKFALEAAGLKFFSELIGKTDYDLWPQFAGEIIKHDQEVMLTGKAVHEDGAINLPNGKIRHFTAIKVPLRDDDDNIIGIIGNYIDVTSQKEAERLRIENEVHRNSAREQEKFTKLANQVAHDIRSPLASLLMIVKSCTQIPEADRIALREAAISIGDIANNLLHEYQKKEIHEAEIEERQAILVSAALLEILTSKKYQYQQLPIKFDSHFKSHTQFAFIKSELSSFKRMMSNLINNAVDALSDSSGKVSLELDVDNKWVKIRILDTGKGMPSELINTIMDKVSITAGKKGGHGIGLIQTWETLARNQGELHIDSELEKGTAITLTFPRMRAPHWIAEEIALTQDDMVIILDDDTSIHGAWRTRFEAILDEATHIQLKHFEQGTEALEFIKTLTPVEKQKVFLLTDYELLKQELNGLHIIAKSGIKRSILVTSHYADPLVREHVAKTGTKILPKQLASEIQIQIKEIEKQDSTSTKVDVVIVDDDKSFSKNLARFIFEDQIVERWHDPEQFMKNIHQYALDTRIYLDNNFSNSPLKGITIAKELHAQGYTRLYLLSGEVFHEGAIPSYLTVIRKDDIESIKNL